MKKPFFFAVGVFALLWSNWKPDSEAFQWAIKENLFFSYNFRTIFLLIVFVVCVCVFGILVMFASGF